MSDLKAWVAATALAAAPIQSGGEVTANPDRYGHLSTGISPTGISTIVHTDENGFVISSQTNPVPHPACPGLKMLMQIPGTAIFECVGDVEDPLP